MSPENSPQASHRRPGFVRHGLQMGLLMLGALAMLFGCGGGGGGVGVGGTGSFASYSSGQVSGFGSVIVNAVRFDDSAARVENADGDVVGRDALRLGMTVEVDGDQIVPGTGGALSSSKASRIRYASEMLGRVEAIDRSAGSLTVLGQTVTVEAQTVFDERITGGLAGLAVGDVIEVYGQLDAAQTRYRATRIEPAAASAGFRLRGVVRQLDPANQRCRIGSAEFSYVGAPSLPQDLANGSLVRMRLQTSQDTAGSWVATAIESGANALPDADEAKLKGLITSFTSANTFSVNGQPVDASGAKFEDGTQGLALGVRVEVEGPVRGGVLRAKEVKIETDDEQDDEKLEFEGRVDAVSPGAATFVLRAEGRSVTIGTSRNDLRYDDGTAANLVVGAKVEVKAVLSADGTRIEATRIKFDD